MKKSVVFILALFVAMGMSCSNAQIGKPKLSGVYVIGSIGMQPGVDLKELESEGVLDFGDEPFNFQKNDTVLLSKKFGEDFFGGTVFKFEFTKKTLLFSNGDKKIEMPYENDFGIIRIDIKNKYLTRIDLVAAKMVK